MYKIADFIMDFKNLPESIKPYFAEYVTKEEGCDFAISVSESEIDAEVDENFNYSRDYLYFIALHRKIAEVLPQNEAFLLHSALFQAEGEGFAFAAHSGTGKTTHLLRWQSYLQDKMTVINGDKPIIRFFENDPTPYAYGTPWNGKERLGTNGKAPLKNICFIERSSTNFVERADKNKIIDRIFNQVYIPQNNPLSIMKTIELIDRLLACCNLYIIHCNMDDNAGEIIYNLMRNA